LLLLAIDYASVISFIYIGGLTIGYTIYVWLLSVPNALFITIIIWIMFIIMLIKHHTNISRLINKSENKLGFLGKIKKVFCHKNGEKIIDEELVESSPEKEIVIDENEKH
jgi:hypothetical protein